MNYLKYLVLALCISFGYGCDDIVEFPAPSGPMGVGYHVYQWVDESRVDPYDDGPRQLKVTVYYPTGSIPEVEAYGEEEVIFWGRSLKALGAELNDQIKQEMSCVRVQKEEGMLAAEGKFPVIMFEHGFGITAGSYQGLVLELVSHGYVVVVPHHTYVADTVLLKGGKQAYQLAERNALAYEVCLEDTKYVLSRLADMPEPMDLERIGMLGHSLGGMTSMRMVKTDDRILAGVQMDAPIGDEALMHHSQYDDGGAFNKPLLHLFAEETISEHEHIGVGAKYVIGGTEHNSFTDQLILMERLPTFKRLSNPDDMYMTKFRQMTRLIHTFFDAHLKLTEGI